MKSTTCASRAPGISSDGRISAAMASRSRSWPGANTRPADAKPGLAGPAIQVAASDAAMVPTNRRLDSGSGVVVSPWEFGPVK